MSISISLPDSFTNTHQTILLNYLQASHRFNREEWQLLYETIDLLGWVRISILKEEQTFKQVYEQQIDFRLADLYIEHLLNLEDIIADSPALTATFAKQIRPILEEANLVQRQASESWLLLAYCV